MEKGATWSIIFSIEVCEINGHDAFTGNKSWSAYSRVLHSCIIYFLVQGSCSRKEKEHTITVKSFGRLQFKQKNAERVDIQPLFVMMSLALHHVVVI